MELRQRIDWDNSDLIIILNKEMFKKFANPIVTDMSFTFKASQIVIKPPYNWFIKNRNGNNLSIKHIRTLFKIERR